MAKNKDEYIKFRCTKGFRKRVDAAAGKDGVSRSAYVVQTLMWRLDGGPSPELNGGDKPKTKLTKLIQT